jgi:uncharacterized SAM-binding protein YcdF (DUF218 family)
MLRARIFSFLGSALVEDDGPQKADCALVLGGDGFGSRIVKAAQLAQAGHVPYVLVDGPSALIGHESDLTITYAEQKGYPAYLFRPIWLPPEVSSTEAEAKYVGRFLKENGVKKVLLVTSNYHTRRAARDFRHEDPWLQVVVVASPDRDFSADGWWKNREGEKTFLLEWTKTVATWVGL